MSSPELAIIGFCWKRTRLMVSLQLIASVTIGVIFLLYLVDNGPWMTPAEILIYNSQTVIVICLITSWLLTSLMSDALAKAGNKGVSFGFPLKTEYSFPLSTFRLAAIPLVYCIGVSYLCFLLPMGFLVTLFDLTLPSAMIHFMLLQYWVVVLSLAWFSSDGVDTLLVTLVLLALFYFDLLLPEFSFSEAGGEFTAGPWSTAVSPFFITVSLAAMYFAGVSKQRSGERLLPLGAFSLDHYQLLNIVAALRWVKTACPTGSGVAALFWRERQTKGIQVAVGTGITLGVLTTLVVGLLRLRDVGPETLTLEFVSSFAFILFSAMFVGVLASMFGITYRNGQARVSLFDRTLPMKTSTIVAVRIVTAFACLIVAGIVHILTIGVTGSLLLEGFEGVVTEYLENMRGITEQGVIYTAFRLVLLLSLIYSIAVLWGVFVSWFALKPREMAIGFAALMFYLLGSVTVIVAVTEGPGFLAMTRSLSGFNAWILIAAILFCITFFSIRLIDNAVMTVNQMLLLCGIGLVLASLQIINLSMNNGLQAYASLGTQSLAQMLGLLPLCATVLALWTQHSLRTH